MSGGNSCLTIPQVAEELQIGKTSVYSLINKGHLKAIRVIGKLRVRRADLDRYLQLCSLHDGKKFRGT